MTDANPNKEKETERAKEREEEDRSYVPVILKRTDESVRHPDDVLEQAIEEGLEQLKRPAASLFLSAIAAGLILGFSVMAVGVVTSLFNTNPEAQWGHLLVAAVYPLGFVLCIMSGAQLFTEHTATAVYPVLDHRAHSGKLIRLWALVIGGNLAGAFFSALLLFLAEPAIQAGSGYLQIAEHLTHFPWHRLFFSAVLAGWLMALGAWLILATPPTISQIACIYMVTFLIGLGGLHHSIAGAVELFAALLVGYELTLRAGIVFFTAVLSGNLVGGSCFVALLNYGHIRQSQKT